MPRHADKARHRAATIALRKETTQEAVATAPHKTARNKNPGIRPIRKNAPLIPTKIRADIKAVVLGSRTREGRINLLEKQNITMRSLILTILAATICFFSCQEKPAPKMSGLAGSLQDSVIIRVWPKELDSLLRLNPNLPIVDIRSEIDFRNSHIFRAMSCDYSSPNFMNRIKKLGLESPIVLYDMNSSVTLEAAEEMKREGFKRVYEIAGGLFSWAREGKTLVTGESKIDSSVILK